MLFGMRVTPNTRDAFVSMLATGKFPFPKGEYFNVA